MGNYLVFHIYGPMVSFGDIAVGEYRPTFAHPSKSGILGLVAGVMGIQRDEEDRLRLLSEGTGFAVLVLTSGILLRDYHTTQVPSAVSIKRHPACTRKDELSIKEQNTILSTRDYRMDALYRVALWSLSDHVNINEIQRALLQPVFAPYLGRKSCPTAIPFQPEIIEAGSARDALVKVKHNLEEFLLMVEGSGRGIARSDEELKYLLYQDPEPNMSDDKLQQNWRKDRLISRRNWQYGDRQEILITVGGNDVLQ